jgi:hypothetical protein
MWKRAALEDLDFFNPSFQLGFEDFDLVARATVRKIPIIILDEVLYRYRRGHSSLSQNWNAGQEIELRNAVNDNLRKLCHHDFKVFLELNSKFGPSIFQSNPDFIFVKQKEIMFNIISTLSIAFYLLPKNLRKFIFRLIRKFFPFSLNYIIKPHEISSIINRLRKNKLLTKIWQKLPNRFKLFFFRKFFPQI